MPVPFGAKPEHGFDQPLGLLSDCHRRIENFLGILIRVMERTEGGTRALAADERDALEAALRYFEVAAPRHTQDEEESLFPRLRACESTEAREALARMEALEADHRRADAMHQQVHLLCRHWLDKGPLADAQRRALRTHLEELRAIYAGHIGLEDSELFPLAGRLLSREQLAEIGREMAQRRGVRSPDGQS